ncbi:MAG: response regulator [Spirochaetota bacterium]
MNGRILIVEDEAIPALELQLRLQSWHYEVTRIEAGGARAIEASREDPPDLVIMDVVLADDVDGLQAAEVIRAEIDVPIVFLTAVESRVAAAVGDDASCAIVSKPYHTADLKDAIERLLA